MSLEMLASFLGFLWDSKNQHALQAPFLYHLYLDTIRKPKHYYPFEALDALRAKLATQKEAIRVQDFGAGEKGKKAKTAQGEKRKINQILKRSTLSPYWAKFLFRLVAERNPKGILELGTSLGLTTLHLALASTAAKVVTFEGCPNIAALARQNFAQIKEQPTFNPDNIHLEVGNIDQTLPLFLEKNQKSASPLPLDFVLIDANHTEAATLHYFELLLPYLNQKSWVVFDDIYWSKGMQRAWTQIRQHPKVRLQVDLFKMGILFFNPELSREHFKLRTFL